MEDDAWRYTCDGDGNMKVAHGKISKYLRRVGNFQHLILMISLDPQKYVRAEYWACISKKAGYQEKTFLFVSFEVHFSLYLRGILL